MKTVARRIALALLILFVAPSLAAQQKEAKVELKLDAIDIKPLNPPDFGADRLAKLNGTGKWVALTLEYTVNFAQAPGKDPRALDDGQWLDDVQVNWNVLLLSSDKRLRARSTFSENYRAVHAGKNIACVMIHPRDVERYLDGDTNLKHLMGAINIKVNGTSRLEVYLVGGRKAERLPAEIRKDSFTNENVRELRGLLISREQSPWEHVQQDIFPRSFRREVVN